MKHSEETLRAHNAAQKRRLRQTPGTYVYNAAHGIGLPGLVKRFEGRRYRRRIIDARDVITLQEMYNANP